MYVKIKSLIVVELNDPSKKCSGFSFQLNRDCILQCVEIAFEIMIKYFVLIALKKGHLIKKCSVVSVCCLHNRHVLASLGRFVDLPISFLRQCEPDLSLAKMSLFLMQWFCKYGFGPNNPSCLIYKESFMFELFFDFQLEIKIVLARLSM